ncbi:HET-domain-containing protein [Cadophora sp. DSE1049]|nr:HET-domain-containing protein [Cadophora sp. DSE1049]
MKLKLVESTGVAPGTKYCTLSHCWGRNEMFTLEQTNYPECLQNIPFEWLTKTFQHAITAATRLGYSYIWIDSLCIIQKDTADWQKEAGTMATVYAQSSLNLAASSASDGQAGMFFPRDPALLQPITISMPSTKIKYSVENPYLWAHSIEDSVLASRGWALQERFLAPRTLHFTTKQLFWECIQGCASESSPTISAQNIFDGHPSIALKGPMPAEMLWDNVVRAYSQTYLSHVADKLIALSGIARAVQARNRDIYLAGMWWTGLETQLLWAVKRTPWMQKRALPAHRLTPKPTRPVEYRAPSWSWAAVDGFISTANERLAGDGVVLISITGSEIVPMHDSDAFGQIKAAYLEVQGEQLKKARVKKGITGSRKICISVKGQWRDLSYILDEEPLTGKEPIYLLLARQHRHPSPAGRPKMFRNEYDILDGLLLTPIEGMAGQYSRLGTWTISGSWGEGLVGAWMGQGVRDLKGFRTLPGVEDSQAYVNVEEDGYKIRLV